MSLSIDFNQMLTTAFDLINGLWPVFVLPIGFTLGLGLLAWIVKSIGGSIKGAAR
jgi:hypothetical protein